MLQKTKFPLCVPWCPLRLCVKKKLRKRKTVDSQSHEAHKEARRVFSPTAINSCCQKYAKNLGETLMPKKTKFPLCVPLCPLRLRVKKKFRKRKAVNAQSHEEHEEARRVFPPTATNSRCQISRRI